MKKRIFIIILTLFLVLFSINVLGDVTYTGDCSTSCEINTSAYYVNLTEGEIITYTFHSEPNVNFACDLQGNCNERGLGRVFVGSFVLGKEINSTCSEINNSNNVRVDCWNADAQNNWTFYENYTQLETLGISGSYRVYDYTLDSTGSATDQVWNGTTKSSDHTATTDGFVDWHSSTGIAGYSFAEDNTNWTLVHTWDEGVEVDFDMLRSGATQSYNSIAIARSGGISSGTWLTQYYRAYHRNESTTGDDQYTSIHNCFKDNPNNACTNISSGEDTTPPKISSLSNTSTNSSITITFNTNENANHTVRLSTGATNISTTYATSHTAIFQGLTNFTTYNYNITVCDNSGNCNTSENYQVTTLQNSNTVQLSDISNSFESGSYSNLAEIGDNDFYLRLTADEGGTRMWFGIEVNNSQGQTVKFRVNTTGTLTPYSSGITGMYSNDISHSPWTRIQDYFYNSSNNMFIFNITLPSNNVYIHPWVPYYYSIVYDYIENNISSLDYVNITHRWNSTENRTMWGLVITNQSKPLNEKRGVAMISSAVHPSENTGPWVAQGALEYLVSNEAEELRNNYVWLFIPFLNPDGQVQGNSRHDTQGENLNRDWDGNQVTEEVLGGKIFSNYTNLTYGGIDVWLDFHSTLQTSSFNIITQNGTVTADHYINLTIFSEYLLNATSMSSDQDGNTDGTAQKEAYLSYGSFAGTPEFSLRKTNYNISYLKDQGDNLTLAIASFLDYMYTTITFTPTNLLNVSQNNDSIYFTWDGVNAEKYILYENGVNTHNTTGNENFYNFTLLTNNTEYCVNLTAYNSTNDIQVSEFSNTVCTFTYQNQEPADTQPNTPTNLLNASQNNQSIYYTWDALAQAEKFILYENGVNTHNTTGNVNFYNLTMLSNNTQYCVNITAYNSTYDIVESNVSNTICTFTYQNIPPDTTPPDITSITENSISSSGATITLITNEAVNATLYYSNESDLSGASTQIKTTYSTSNVFTLIGLLNNTQYYYQINISDVSGNTNNSQVLTFNTTQSSPSSSTTVDTNRSINQGIISGMSAFQVILGIGILAVIIVIVLGVILGSISNNSFDMESTTTAVLAIVVLAIAILVCIFIMVFIGLTGNVLDI